MLDLYEELKALVSALERRNLRYAVCGGLAMAVHAFPRATVDIDLLVAPEDVAPVLEVAAGLGYELEAMPMSFAEGRVPIRRVSKIDPETEDLLSLDLLVVTPATLPAFEGRRAVEWEGRTLWVVSREGLILLKSLRGSGQDRDDIQRLTSEAEDEG